ADAARSCSTIPTCIITAMRKPRSAAWRRRPSAIRRCSYRSMPCIRARRAGGRSLPSSTRGNKAPARGREGRAPAGPQRAPPAPSAHVTIRGLTKHFPDAVLYDRFDLDIPRGKLVSIFGPNGCGKSTLINMITGLIPTDAGEILFDGKPLRDIKFGYVFQNYREALFPWLRAIDNIQYPLN